MSNDIVMQGKVVFLTYSVLNDAGQVVEQHDNPQGYVHRSGAAGSLSPIDEVTDALEGHVAGDQVEVPMDFEPHDPKLVFVDELENAPPQFRHVGATVPFEDGQGETQVFRVVDISDGKITLDGNSPLAGKTGKCVFNIVTVRDATEEELQSGIPAEMRGMPSLH